MVTLVEKSEKPYQSLSEMRDGDIAILRVHDMSKHGVGKIYQRHNLSLICLGGTYGQTYPSIFVDPVGDEIRVEILPKGTLLEI